jgi:hypothetical protein
VNEGIGRTRWNDDRARSSDLTLTGARDCGVPFGRLARRALVSVFDPMTSLGDQRGALEAHELCTVVSLLANRTHRDKP